MSSDKIVLHVNKRDTSGKISDQPLARTSILANLYGLKIESEALFVNRQEFLSQLAKHGELGLVYLDFADEKRQVPALAGEVDFHPVTDSVQHIAFRRVDLQKKIITTVPIEVVGEVSIPDSLIETVLSGVEIEALPGDIPENIEVDISHFTEIGQVISVGELQFDRSKLALIATEEELGEPVVIVQKLKEEVEPEEVEVAEETEVGGGAEAKEGEGSESSDADQVGDSDK